MERGKRSLEPIFMGTNITAGLVRHAREKAIQKITHQCWLQGGTGSSSTCTTRQQMGAQSLDSQDLLHESEGPRLIRLDARGAGLGQRTPDMGSHPFISPTSTFQPVFLHIRNSTNTLRKKTATAVEEQRLLSCHSEGSNTCNRNNRNGGCNIRRELWTNEALHAAIEAVDNGTMISHAARAANIPDTSLCDHMFGRTIRKKRGPQIVLT